MSRDWESQFRSWAAPPGTTEEQRCENAVSAVRNALKRSTALAQRDYAVFLQGSYNNNTNARGESDVDIGVICRDTFFYDLPDGGTAPGFGISPASYSYAQFKRDVGDALVAYFGARAIGSDSNKAFDVHETSYHVEADVAPFFEHRRYNAAGGFAKGVELHPDNGSPPRVINWPDQHYDNGVAKNKSTGMRYKALVRVLKNLKKEMVIAKNAAAEPAVGFLIECLVWNVPNDNFGNAAYSNDLRNVLTFLYNATAAENTCSEWGEVSELKYLFRGPQKWTRAQAHAFTLAAWQHVGFN